MKIQFMRRFCIGLAVALLVPVATAQLSDTMPVDHVKLIQSSHQAIDAMDGAVAAARFDAAREQVGILRKNFMALRSFWSTHGRADVVRNIAIGMRNFSTLEELLGRHWGVPVEQVKQVSAEVRKDVVSNLSQCVTQKRCMAPAPSQEWDQYLAFDDFFSINFPGEPTIRDTTYKTQYGYALPARVYEAKDEFGSYSVTAVNWSTAAEQHAAGYKACMASTGELRGGENPGICSETRGRNEIAGATAHAVFGLLERGSKVLEFALQGADRVDGFTIVLLNADQSTTFAVMTWHEGYLYIAEATAPKNAPAPGSFPVSINYLDKEGRRIQYDGGRYTPGWPVPKRSR
jgi:hypothetical protein